MKYLKQFEDMNPNPGSKKSYDRSDDIKLGLKNLDKACEWLFDREDENLSKAVINLGLCGGSLLDYTYSMEVCPAYFIRHQYFLDEEALSSFSDLDSFGDWFEGLMDKFFPQLNFVVRINVQSVPLVTDRGTYIEVLLALMEFRFMDRKYAKQDERIIRVHKI